MAEKLINEYCPMCGSSFYVKRSDGKYSCFNCFASGDSIETRLTGDLKERKECIPILEDACKVFQENLKKDKKGKAYAESRGLTSETIEKFRIGYSSGNLLEKLGGKYSEEELISSGLVRKAKNGDIYEVFRYRLMFPVISAKYGRVRAFGGRRTYKSDKSEKYLNSSNSDWYVKGDNLFGLYTATQNGNVKHLYAVEGYMDCVSMAQHGISNVCALCGTALTDHQALLLRNAGVKRLTICLDSDDAGYRGAKKASDILRKYNIKCDFLSVPGGSKDPDEYIKAHSAEEFYLLKPIERREFLLKHYEALRIPMEELPLYF